MKKLGGYPLLFFSFTLLSFFIHRVWGGFDRTFIAFDDTVFIDPLIRSPFLSYFTEWLWNRNHFAYPISDLTFYIDSWISNVLGVSSYWLTQWALFTVYLYVVFRLVRRIFPTSSWLSFFLLATLAFHPLNVEVVQWLSARRVLIVGIFLLLGTENVWRFYSEPNYRNFKSIRRVIFWWGLSLLSNADGVLWVVWVSFCLGWVADGRLQKILFRVFISSIVVSLIYISWVSQAGEYANGIGALFTFEALERIWYFFPRIIGRAVVNLILPVRVVPYYSDLNIFPWIGLSLLLFLIWATRPKTKPTEKEHFFWGASFFLFLPHGLVLFYHEEFLLADRYLFSILPYVLFALAFAFKRQFSNVPPYALHGLRTAAGSAIAWMVFLSFETVPAWRTSAALFENCAKTEKSPLCLMLTIDDFFQLNQCEKAKLFIEEARYLNRARHPKHSSRLNLDLPFFDTGCVVLPAQLPFNQRRLSFEEKLKEYGPIPQVYLPWTIALLKEHRLEEAWQTAQNYLPKIGSRIFNMSNPFAYVFLGHVAALCEINGTEECRMSQALLQKAVSIIPEDRAKYKWGYTATKTSN